MSPSSPAPTYQQHGVALLTVLLVVALATVVAVSMTARQQIDIRRTGNLLNADQAYLYALGGESWARRILARDGSSVDSAQDIWATPLPPTSVPGGVISGLISDLQGRFNLNNLVIEEDDSNRSSENLKLARQRFERLLTVLELPTTLSTAIIDWADPDVNPIPPDGAEDNTYLLRQPAYRAANTLFRSPSELLLVAGIDRDVYNTLLPHITTLPVRTPLNLNSITVPILMAIVPDLQQADAESLLALRDETPFDTVQTFLTHEKLAGLAVSATDLAVNSHYFLLFAEAEIERNRALLTSLLYRNNNAVQVLMRSRGRDF